MAAPKSWSRVSAAAFLAAALALPPAPAQAQDGMSLIRDTEIEETLREYSDPLMVAAGMEPKGVDILLIGSKDFNAFAGPGVIGVFTGLILESETPNQLQGVIA